jgi:hypothetical protein
VSGHALRDHVVVLDDQDLRHLAASLAASGATIAG